MKPLRISFYMLLFLSTISCSNMIEDYLGGKKPGCIPRNAVGATDSITLRTLGFTPSNDNSIFVSKLTGNDNTGTGTQSNPVASINRAITICDAQHQRVIILDSENYEEKGFEFVGDFNGLYAAVGEMPTISTIVNPLFWSINELKSETTFHDDETTTLDVELLSNGNIFIAYRDNTDGKGKYMVINTSDWSIEKSETVFYDYSVNSISVSLMHNNNIFISFVDEHDSSKGKYIVINPSTWEVAKLVTTYHDEVTGFTTSTVLQNGNIFIAYRDQGDSFKGNYIVLNPDSWNIVKSETNLHNESTGCLSATLLPDGNIFVAYPDIADSVKGKFIVLSSSTWEFIQTETVFKDGQTGAVSSIMLNNGSIFITYRDWDDNNKGKYIVLKTASWEELKSETIFHDALTFYTSPLTLSNGNIFIAYGDLFDSNKGKYIVLENSICHIRISTDTTLNGITFTSISKAYLDKFILSESSKITAQWCYFKNIQSSTSNQNSEVIYCTGDIIIRNSRFYNNDIGIYSESDKASIIDSQFYGNSVGYALHLKGAAVNYGDITINHCDLFNNYGGIRLENNSGINEIIKNTIFHRNSDYGVYADNQVSLTNSICTDSVINTIYGTQVIEEDPLYVDEGNKNPDDIDLHIQVRHLGYPVDSPAKWLADDGRNAGSWDVEYVGR